MTDEGVTPWVAQYRASTVDPVTPDLDRAILAAARRHLVRRKYARRVLGTSFLGGVAILTVGVMWRAQHPGYLPHTITEYGRVEGISRRYLLEVQAQPFTGYGITEGNT